MIRITTDPPYGQKLTDGGQDGQVTEEDNHTSALTDQDQDPDPDRDRDRDRDRHHVQVRKARMRDEPDIAALDAAAWSPESGFPSVIQAADGSFFSPDSPPEVHLVAEINGRIAGYLRLKPMTKLPENAHVLGIFGLAVTPAARRRGVAAALLTAAEDQARAQGAAKLSLRVLSTNDSAIRLYERQGFQHEGLLRGEFIISGSYVDDVLMAKQVPARLTVRPSRQKARPAADGQAQSAEGAARLTVRPGLLTVRPGQPNRRPARRTRRSQPAPGLRRQPRCRRSGRGRRRAAPAARGARGLAARQSSARTDAAR